jgi:hypothetical protein
MASRPLIIEGAMVIRVGWSISNGGGDGGGVMVAVGVGRQVLLPNFSS